MTYSFHGTVDEMTASILEDLRKAALGGQDSDAYFRRALISLVGQYDRQALQGPADPQQLEHRRHQLCEALSGFLNKIAAYTALATILAEGANDDEWYELCVRRSAIQALLDECAGTLVAKSIDATEVAEFDAELRRVGLEQGPVPKECVPRGLPGSHWWWQYPRPSEGS